MDLGGKAQQSMSKSSYISDKNRSDWSAGESHTNRWGSKPELTSVPMLTVGEDREKEMKRRLVMAVLRRPSLSKDISSKASAE